MYTVRVERTISAAHALELGGTREPMHGHNWRVEVTLEGERLDADGLLVDFHAMERALAGILEPYHNGCFNTIPPFDRTNPTAELVAHFVATAMQVHLPTGVRVRTVAVSEAPGCIAAYHAPRMEPVR